MRCGYGSIRTPYSAGGSWSIQSTRTSGGHPLVIRRAFERAQRVAITDPPRDEPDSPPPNPEATARRRRAAAAALDEAVVRVDQSTDRLRDTVSDMEVITGRRITPLEYDLSTDQLTAESARNFYEVYGAAYDDRILQFANELISILEERRLESYRPRRQRSRPAPPTRPRFTRGNEPPPELEPISPSPPRFTRGN
jgi:hypothetical protein